MTSEILQSALRQEANSIKNIQGSSTVTVLFSLLSGETKLVKLNPDGSWRNKPTDTNGLIRFEWVDSEKGGSSIQGTTYTIVEVVHVEYIDPTAVLGFTFSYDKTTTTNVPVETEE